MPNTLLTPDIITREALKVLHEKLIFINKINTQYDGSFGKKGAKIGDTLRIRKPAKFKVRSGKTYAGQDVIETNTTLKIANQLGVDADFTDEDLSLKIDDFSKLFIEPAMSQLATSVEAEVLESILLAGNSVYNASGLDYADTLKARKSLQYSLAPNGDRTMIIDPATSVGLVNELKGLFQDSTQISKQYREGLMGVTSGFKFYESNIMPLITNPADIVGTVTVAEGASVATFAGLGASVTIPKGFRFSVAGLNKCHAETKKAYNELYEFVVLEDFTTDGAGAGTAVINPVYASTTDARQNVVGTLPTAAAIAVAGAADEVKRTGIAFTKDAFVFATAPLNIPNGTDMASQVSMDGISLRFVRDFDINSGDMKSRFDIIFGYNTLREEFGVLMTEPNV